ncbi:Peptidoglycan/LPS O-acetylase OafA/YrhL, contains acyltransferase and SGNH-hydrolase domains [Muriicola jejuensis]|uniref:Acyltransferase family protein n=1 Tax=Muriicola jejuensis TaxID=504488 RepID=A0A6P0UA54_9FLAO|nr:acyltransferase family protein [Muriicola jejuensis]NER10095.1 acyltransferase family protein [Muriicola jejuensis]SMP02938.1 Peptidoglycan/LPS O-acetylase OafA/YrhL, contains acyltransferase and SGNH-hydrolase domains [Muriicola jejuensis]
MRRYDLDWLRVFVFGLLILYHVGMFFVPWGWHIKNNVEYSWIRFPMLFVNQWRLPILFVISGMGTYYALNKRTPGQFSLERIRRLFLPLVVGMLLVVPPQVYVERIAEGQFNGSYFEFWPSQAFMGVYPEGNLSWHHLWFLPYLLLFSLALLPVFVSLRKHPDGSFLRWVKAIVSRRTGLFWFLIPLYLTESLVEPFFEITHALIGDWFAIANYSILFFFGFLLMTVQDTFWKTVTTNRRFYLYCAITGFTLYLGLIMSFEDSITVHFTEAFLKVFNLWSWILVLFGYAATYWNKSSRTLSYCNEAVYPFYILHQTVTIIAGFFIMDLNWGFLPKFLYLIATTFAGSWILYEFGIRRWKWIRPLFGLKTKKATSYLQTVGSVPQGK